MPNEKFILENNISLDSVLNYYNSPLLAMNKYFTYEEAADALAIPKSYFDQNDVRTFFDFSNRCINVVGGHRVTSYQPIQSKRTIFIVGGCHIFGYGIDDRRTIESYLQQIINENTSKDDYCVQNYGFFIQDWAIDNPELTAGQDMSKLQINEIQRILEYLPLKTGDIILFLVSEYFSNRIKYININKNLKRDSSIDLFFESIPNLV